jgi:hypothetical protein
MQAISSLSEALCSKGLSFHALDVNGCEELGLGID